MGLAPFGRPPGPVDVRPEAIETYADLRRLAADDPVIIESKGQRLNATLAYYVQLGLELQLTSLFEELLPICSRNGIEPSICLGGGTALNAVANQLAFERTGFERLHFHPACGDDGTAIGAALWFWHHQLGNPRRPYRNDELMYSVRSYGARAFDRAIERRGDALHALPTAGWVERAAELVAGGAIVGWFDGASEIGPRALGHRSILADPRDPGMKDRLNERVKFREWFRPFAPSVLAERSQEWFGIADSPYMLRAAPVLQPGVPAITHVDGTARVQTVAREDNPAYHRVIATFHELTGVPMVLNTSLNVKGEPIVETPDDALDALLGSGLDCLVAPGWVIAKAGDRVESAPTLAGEAT
jgi:carbamoyltransferase